VVLFERATFLVISHALQSQHYDAHRFEKISNIIKQFKLSVSKTQAQFQGMEVRSTALVSRRDEHFRPWREIHGSCISP
jgi:Ras-related GTP-binding protein A/B